MKNLGMHFYYFGKSLEFLNVLELKMVPVNHCTVFTTIRALVTKCLTMYFTVFLIPAYQQVMFQQQHQGHAGSKCWRSDKGRWCFHGQCVSVAQRTCLRTMLSLLCCSEKSILHSLEVFQFYSFASLRALKP